MTAPWWFETFMESRWYDKLFWLFFAGMFVGIAVIWIKVLFEMLRFPASRPTPARRAKSSGGGFAESVSSGLGSSAPSAEAGLDSGSSGSESGGGGGGGGSDFSGGGGESGGGGSTGSWS